MPVAVEVFDNFDACAGVSRLLDRAHQPHPFLRFDWFRLLNAHLDAPAPLIMRACDDGGENWVFLTRTGRGQAQGLSNYYTLAYDSPESAGGDAPARLTAIAQALKSRLGVSALSFAPLQTAAAEHLGTAFRVAGWWVNTQETSTRWTCPVADMDFAAYWAARPGALRATVKRKGAKAKAQIVIDTRFTPSGWAEYESVYQDSWKPDEGNRALLRAFAEAEGEAGTLRLGRLAIGGEAVAAQLWTVDSGVAYIHKLAYRADAAALSPGSLLSAAMARHVLDIDRVALIDFGTGDDRYKADWMTQRAPLLTLTAAHPMGAAGLSVLAKQAARRLAGR